MIEAVGSEEQRHAALVDDAQLAVGLGGGGAAGEDLADELAHRPVAGLVGEVDGAAFLLQPLRQELRLRGGAGAVEPFEDDETTGRRHVPVSSALPFGCGAAPGRGLVSLSNFRACGGRSMPNSTRSSRTRASSKSSRRRLACARR